MGISPDPDIRTVGDMRIAWLWPGNRFCDPERISYWGPLLKGFRDAYPKTVFITTGKVHPECEKIFKPRSVGEGSWRKVGRKKKGVYEGGMGFFSPAVVPLLFRMGPDFIVSTEFSMWTMLATAFRRLGRWKVVVLYEGYSPSHSFEDSPVRFFLRRWVAGRVDAFVTNSRKGKEYLESTLGASGGKVFKVAHELPVTAKAEERRGEPLPISGGARPRFLYVGQLIHRKGVDLLLESWVRLKDALPEAGSLWIVGAGEKKEKLIRRAEELKVKDVNFAGEVKKSEIGPWYEACDVFVFPTREDTWGLVVLEAMSAGKAVLCSKNAGSSDLVREGENGFVFDPEDTEQLARRMREFVDSPGSAARCGERSGEIMEKYTHEKAVKELGEVLTVVMTSGGTARQDIVRDA